MSIKVVKKCLVRKCPGQNMSGQEMSGQKLESQEKGVEKCRSTNVWSRNVHESPKVAAKIASFSCQIITQMWSNFWMTFFWMSNSKPKCVPKARIFLSSFKVISGAKKALYNAMKHWPGVQGGVRVTSARPLDGLAIYWAVLTSDPCNFVVAQWKALKIGMRIVH